jgi:hypothetical protein
MRATVYKNLLINLNRLQETENVGTLVNAVIVY